MRARPARPWRNSHTMTNDRAIQLTHIGKTYRIYNRPEDRLKQMVFRGTRTFFREFHALRDISLTVNKGETVGLVGCNGSGKSTLLQIVCGTLIPTTGEREVQGRISALLELGAGFNPDFTGRENIFLNAAILGLSKDETVRRYDEIVAFSGLEPMHLEQPVKTYSSGMYVRLAFAVAVAVEPDILVVDEALAVGDEGFQRKCYARLHDLKERGTTILFVSHAAQTVIDLCDRAVLMDHGECLSEGTPKQIIADYHRLLFAPDSRRCAIRDSIVHDGAEGRAEEIAAPDDELSTESRVEYEKHGGEINDIFLSDLSGAPVTALRSGGRYQLHYTVSLTDEARQPCFGMLVKTKRGVDIGGAVARRYAHGAQKLDAGTLLTVCFTFDCPLRPGHYFINCGATRREGERDIFIHRIVDALQFKVTDDRERTTIEPAGMIDLNIEAQIGEARASAALDRPACI